MSTRREFVAQAAIAGCALTLGAADSRARKPDVSSKPLRVLILGGTGNIGPYHVRAAVARGHHVSVFSRGRTAADLPSTVERLTGDRDGDLGSIKGRDWDAVVDIASFGPRWVRTLGEALKGRVRHYTFISTIAVYDRPEDNEITDESSRVLVYRASVDPYTVTTEGPQYGAIKILCEREAESQFPGRALVVRPGYIGGPGDTHGILPYWPLRMEHGGEVLAVGDPSAPVQFIDVRDMAEWIVRMMEQRGTGTFNAVGPAMPTNQGDVINVARNVVSARSKVTWVPSPWLAKQEGNDAFGTLVFWEINKGHLTRFSNARALAQGLTTRALNETLGDTLRWSRTQPGQDEVRTGPRRKPDGSGFEMGHVPWPAYLEREKAILTAWHGKRSAST